MNQIDKNTISKYLRDKTGKKTTSIIKELNISKAEFYEAINGRGSRRTRVEIAKMIDLPPSIVWLENELTIKIVDDLHYLGVVK